MEESTSDTYKPVHIVAFSLPSESWQLYIPELTCRTDVYYINQWLVSSMVRASHVPKIRSHVLVQFPSAAKEKIVLSHKFFNPSTTLPIIRHEHRVRTKKVRKVFEVFGNQRFSFSPNTVEMAKCTTLEVWSH